MRAPTAQPRDQRQRESNHVSIQQPMSIEHATPEATLATSFPPGRVSQPESDVCASEPACAYPPAPTVAKRAALVPCSHPATGCPVGVDVPAVAAAVLRSDHEEAFRIVRGSHPFASTCGHSCHAPCESACRRRLLGAPVAIGALEGYAAAFVPPILAAPEGPCTSRFDARSIAGAIGRSTVEAVSTPRSGKTVAIVGGGAAGLACAHDLALLGHRAIVFDARSEPGGMMTAVIPAFRFARASAQAECAAIFALDVEFHPQASIGAGRTLQALLGTGIHAVFVAIGASRPLGALLEAEQPHPDICDAMDVLTGDEGPTGATLVVGEGALAVDAARSLLVRARGAAGAEGSSVQLVLTSRLNGGDVPPAMLAACARDGIRIRHEWRARRVQLDAESGLLEAVEIARPDGSAAEVLACDRLVLAPPRAPDVRGLEGEIEVTRSGFVAADPVTLQTSMPNVWAGGACVFGHRSIAHAVADGKRAAWEIHAAMMGLRVTATFASAWVEVSSNGNGRSHPSGRRRALPLIETPPIDPFAPTTPRAAERAAAEASRCLQCARIPVLIGECSTCSKCVEVCPTGAVSLVESGLAIDPELCHRCHACVDACPDGSLAMLKAEWEERIAFA